MIPYDFSSIMAMLPYQCENDMKGIKYFKTIFDCLYFLRYAHEHTVEETVGKILYLLSGEENPNGVFDSLKKVIRDSALSSLDDLYRYMNLMINYSDEQKVEWSVDMEKVSLMTSHESKGLEFKVVIVINAEDYEDTEEDRKLLYVAMSRAKEKLYLTTNGAKEVKLFNEIKDKFILGKKHDVMLESINDLNISASVS